MVQVQPNYISLCPTSTRALKWLLRHWNQAKGLDLELVSLPIGAAPEYIPDVKDA